MAYNLTKSDGSSLITLNDGVTDNTVTDLTLVGKNFAGYGQFLNENFIYLLENFSNTIQPSTPLQGQLWWNSLSKTLQVWTGIAWKGISSTAAQATAPLNPNVGDLWWDTVNAQLKVLSTLPSTWTVIGPQYSAGLGLTGAIATTVVDTLAITHIVVEFVVNNIVVAILSRDTPAYTISSPPNFSNIAPGLTLANDITVPYQFTGNVTNALNLNGSANYLRSDQSGSITGNLWVDSTQGLFVGTSKDISINTTGTTANIAGQTSGKSTVFYVNVSGNQTQLLTLDANLGIATVPNLTYLASSGLSITNKYYVDDIALSSTDYTGAGNIVSTKSATITNTATTSPTTIVNVSASQYRSAEFLIQATDNSSLKYQISKILALQDGTTAYSSEYGSISSGNVIATYSSTLAGGPTGNLAILATPASANSTTFRVTTISVTK
jgi:hypothetical protein